MKPGNSPIIVVGPQCAGKSVFCDLAIESGVPAYNISDDVWALASRERHVGEDIRDFVERRRAEAGPLCFTERTAARVPGDGRFFVISGCRRIEEIHFLRERYGASVLQIVAGVDDRFARSRARGREDAAATLEEFVAQDARELGWGLRTILEEADDAVANNRDLESFRLSVSLRLTALRG